VLLGDSADALEYSRQFSDVAGVVELSGSGQKASLHGIPNADGSFNQVALHVDNFLLILFRVEKDVKDLTVDVLNRLCGGRSHVD